ncbi:MAG: alpha-isopropylmalate synthase regulatory domain-containing protein, partial [Myxococcota bacterium]|nr:alpha-isopropylmalate synthase regulatory domain-containing protein [Myxococcota bacterium]
MSMEQKVLEDMVRDVLGAEYLEFEVTRYVLTEDVREHSATIVCQFRETGAEGGRAVEGKGVGMIDALFKGLKKTLSSDYPSLDHIHFVDFRIDGDFKTRQSDDGSDAMGRVRLVVENSSGRRFDFESSSLSISASSVDVVVKAVEHFVNAEHAVAK